jgi:hypothetical protein
MLLNLTEEELLTYAVNQQNTQQGVKFTMDHMKDILEVKYQKKVPEKTLDLLEDAFLKRLATTTNR